MAINEVFPNPTVKAVFFEIRYPNLFFIEQKIGDLQVELLDLLPDSSLGFRRHFLMADIAPDTPLSEVKTPGFEPTPGQKVWQLSSPNRVKVSIQTNLLIIESQTHKTYRQEGHEKFRDVIERVVNAFLAIVKIPTLTRIGLRYLDECLIPQKTNASLRDHVNTTFPVDRFSLEAASAMQFSAVVERNGTKIRFVEALKSNAGEAPTLVLDFDAYQENIASATYLQITDQLHTAVSDEFEASVRAPLIARMRMPKE